MGSAIVTAVPKSQHAAARIGRHIQRAVRSGVDHIQPVLVNETYHVATTHPQFNKFGTFRGWAKAQGKHSNIGYDAPADLTETKSKIRLGSGDPRISTAEMQVYTLEETNAATTRTVVEAAKRLADELPADTPPDKVLSHWLAAAGSDDAARGVNWPTTEPEHLAKSGTAWRSFRTSRSGRA